MQRESERKIESSRSREREREKKREREAGMRDSEGGGDEQKDLKMFNTWRGFIILGRTNLTAGKHCLKRRCFQVQRYD
jgi:hypothetical protein